MSYPDEPAAARPEDPDSARRRARAASIAVLVCAGLIAIWLVAGTIVDVRRADPNAWFSPGEVAAAGAVTIAVLLAVAWVFRRHGRERFGTVLAVLLAVWPVGWLLAWLDSATVDLINTLPVPAGPVLALLLLVVAPLVTASGLIGGAVGALAR